MSRRYSAFAFLGLMSLLLLSCSKDDTSMNTNPPASGDSYKGDFVASAHSTSGTASINKDATTLFLKNFKTSTGPDLNIYLASDVTNVEGDYVDLGDIQGVDGDYTYTLPGGTDFSKYKYIVVWCVTFHVNFGYAQLIPQ